MSRRTLRFSWARKMPSSRSSAPHLFSRTIFARLRRELAVQLPVGERWL